MSKSELSESAQALPYKLPENFISDHKEFINKYKDEAFHKLSSSLKHHFTNDDIWTEAKDLDYALTSNKWMQVVSPLLATRIICIWHQLPVIPWGDKRYPFNVPDSVTALLGSVVGPLGCKSVIANSHKEYEKSKQNNTNLPDKPNTVLSLLMSAKRLDDDNKIQKIKFNFLAAAFHIAVLKLGVIQFPKKSKGKSAWAVLLDTIACNNDHVSASPLLETLRKEADTSFGKEFDPLRWQMPLHMSLAYSPIALVQRKKMFGRGVDRRNLAESLGNSERPEALVHIEWIIWSNLFQLADCLLTVEEVLDNIFRDTLPHLHKMSDADNRFYSSTPQPIEERSPHPESGMPPPPYTKDAQPGPSNNANVLNDDNDDEFWISLDQDAAASERFLGFLIEYLSNNPHVLPRAEFVQLASLYRLAPQTYLNDEIIHYFAQQWAKEAPQKNLLWLDSFFASSFLFREQECITADAQTHRQDLLFHRLDKCFLEQCLHRLDICFIIINERNEHWYAAFINFIEKTIQVCDSSPSGARGEQMLPGLLWLATSLSLYRGEPIIYAEWHLLAEGKVPHQNNSHCCGLHVLWYLKHLLYHGRIDGSQTHPDFSITPDMTGKRVQLLVEYLQRCGVFLDDISCFQVESIASLSV